VFWGCARDRSRIALLIFTAGDARQADLLSRSLEPPPDAIPKREWSLGRANPDLPARVCLFSITPGEDGQSAPLPGPTRNGPRPAWTAPCMDRNRLQAGGR
jgi:hypothetical protein